MYVVWQLETIFSQRTAQAIIIATLFHDQLALFVHKQIGVISGGAIYLNIETTTKV